MGNLPVSKGFVIVVIAIFSIWFFSPHMLFSSAEKNIAREENNFNRMMADRRERVDASIASLKVTDPNLLACIKSAAADRARIPPTNSGGIDDVRELRVLICIRRQISSIKGIEELAALEHLDLSENSITNLEPLQHLKALESLSIRDNPVTNIQVLVKLGHLSRVTLPTLSDTNCSDIKRIIGEIRANLAATRCRDESTLVENEHWNNDNSGFSQVPKLTRYQEAELQEYERNSRKRD